MNKGSIYGKKPDPCTGLRHRLPHQNKPTTHDKKAHCGSHLSINSGRDSHSGSDVHDKSHHMELENFENDDETSWDGEYYPLDKAKRLFDYHLNEVICRRA